MAILFKTQWHTSWKEFKRVILPGDNTFTLLEEPVKLYVHDLSKSMPSNFKDYVQKKIIVVKQAFTTS